MSRLGGIIGGELRRQIEEDLLPAGKRMQKQIAKEKAKNWEKEYAESQKGLTMWNYLFHTGQYKQLPAWWE
jgi:hypothetical protein